jgi:phage tail sheath protein FI
MTAYKTPGVYVEEIVKFPPSVAQVETAIPAFIGYTEKATNKIVGDLGEVPTRITSMLEYEAFFGYAKSETTIDVTINDTVVDGETEQSIVVDQPSSREPFLMYYSMQMYFANGGGPCYIVSVGRYGDKRSSGDAKITAVTDDTDFNKGLAEVRKVDEVTLILYPDATALTDDTTFYGLYNSALTQCNELQDRFTIIDPRTYDGTSPTDANIAILREKLNLQKDYLKYGAAYYPFIKTILNYRYDEDKIKLKHNASSDKALSGVAADVQEQIDVVQASRDEIDSQITALGALPVADGTQVDDTQSNHPDRVRDAASVIVEAINTELDSIATANDTITATTQTTADAVASEDESLKDDLETLIATLGGFFSAGHIKNIIGHTDDTKGVSADYAISDADYGNDALVYAAAINTKITNLGTYFSTTNPLLDNPGGGLNDYLVILNDATPTGLLAKLADANVADDGGAYDDKSLKELQTLNNALYNQIRAEIASLPMELPPSSSIAGVYARVDSDRGVWKAPANVGLNYVIEPSVQVSHDDQKDLNVHTAAGKSINAIRTFTGKGVLVWGARTLAGNDNEWRYISVRRFFNMAEESIKKATEQFVFEPNDKNTWVRVKAMINNFLTSQWRAGALAGPTPEKAFYVNIGLGETMTAVDILEGNMIVEIGMAVVRPAEFIILKFSHKMQEA